MLNRPKERRRRPQTDLERLAVSPLFDDAWYLRAYRHVAATGMAALDHYFQIGGREGLDPHPLFDTRHYLSLAGPSAHNQPLLHYVSTPPEHAVSPHPLFDSVWYCERYSDVVSSGLAPLEHFVAIGAGERRNPSPQFNTAEYLRIHPEAENEGVNALLHMVMLGGRRLGEIPLPKQPGAPKSRVTVVRGSLLPSTLVNDPSDIAIIMPSADLPRARQTADLLLERAGIPAHVILAHDTAGQGFIASINAISSCLQTRYIVYLEENAYPGFGWLRTARDRLEATGKGLLAFNCGRWQGRVAAFGMVRMQWVTQLYGGPVFNPAYRHEKADAELTVIARATDQLMYDPGAVLLAVEGGTPPGTRSPYDRALFGERFRSGFDRTVPLSALKPLASSYYVGTEFRR